MVRVFHMHLPCSRYVSVHCTCPFYHFTDLFTLLKSTALLRKARKSTEGQKTQDAPSSTQQQRVSAETSHTDKGETKTRYRKDVTGMTQRKAGQRSAPCGIANTNRAIPPHRLMSHAPVAAASAGPPPLSHLSSPSLGSPCLLFL